MDWIESLDGAVTVSDLEGTIIYMNEKASKVFQKRGGKEALIGTKLKDCHNPVSNAKITEMMGSHEKNVYTIEKRGIKKIIYQAPWYKEGEFAGLIELSLEIPFEMPHFIREE